MSDVDTSEGKRRRNKRWPEALKREIVAATYLPGASVSVVARQYDVNANQVFSWRRRYRDANADLALPPAPPTPGLMPVMIAPAPEDEKAPPPEPARSDTIEIEVSGDYRIRVGSGFERPGTQAHSRCAEAAMILVPSGVRVWLAVGKTDMRRGMNGLSLQVQETLGRDPFAGDLFVFRGKRGDLIKILWHDGLGLSLYAKRLERGRFVSYDPCQHGTDNAVIRCSGAAAIEGSAAIGMGQDAESTRRSLRLLFGDWAPHDDGASEGCLALATDVSAFARPT